MERGHHSAGAQILHAVIGCRFTVRQDQIKTLDLEVIRTLAPREELVLRLRFGFHGHQWHLQQTRQAPALRLAEVGNILNVTRERIRQIESKALRKLRHPSRRKRLFSEREFADLKDDLKTAEWAHRLQGG